MYDVGNLLQKYSPRNIIGLDMQEMINVSFDDIRRYNPTYEYQYHMLVSSLSSFGNLPFDAGIETSRESEIYTIFEWAIHDNYNGNHYDVCMVFENNKRTLKTIFYCEPLLSRDRTEILPWRRKLYRNLSEPVEYRFEESKHGHTSLEMIKIYDNGRLNTISYFRNNLSILLKDMDYLRHVQKYKVEFYNERFRRNYVKSIQFEKTSHRTPTDMLFNEDGTLVKLQWDQKYIFGPRSLAKNKFNNTVRMYWDHHSDEINEWIKTNNIELDSEYCIKNKSDQLLFKLKWC